MSDDEYRRRLKLALRSPGRPIHRQLAQSLREAVLTGQFRPGTRLPSTRALAADLGVSRNTVVEAYAQLISEAYFESRTGSGTFVSSALPEDLPVERPAPTRAPVVRPPATLLSANGLRVTAAYASYSDDALRPFSPGIPALDPGLFEGWWRLASRRRQRLNSAQLSYGDPAGYEPLRRAIASYLGPSRGVRCTPEQVIVTSGTQQALALTARLLLDPGDHVWIEEPGYAGARAALASAGAQVISIPVDDEGLDVEQGTRMAPRARLAYVSPSHQYPLAVTMSTPRRLRLLDWAQRADAWILEDDYDSEFRYEGRALPALQGLDRSSRVLYFGTFSKALFPALRIGYVVVPLDLVNSFRLAHSVCGHTQPILEQSILADFISAGYFTRHVRRMRQRYGRARTILESEVSRRLGSSLTISGGPVGLHVVALLTPKLNDQDVSKRAAAMNLSVPALSGYYATRPAGNGFVLGYGHLDEAAIRAGVATLEAAIRSTPRSRPPAR